MFSSNISRVEYYEMSWKIRCIFHIYHRTVVGFTTTYAISDYHHLRYEFESRTWRGTFDITLSDKVCQWLAAGLWFSSGTPVFSTNKAYHHNIAEILLKVALNTITLTLIIRTRSTEKIMEERTSTTVQQNKRTKAWTNITNRELHQLFQKWQSPNSQKSVAKYIFLNLHYYSLK